MAIQTNRAKLSGDKKKIRLLTRPRGKTIRKPWSQYSERLILHWNEMSAFLMRAV